MDDALLMKERSRDEIKNDKFKKYPLFIKQKKNYQNPAAGLMLAQGNWYIHFAMCIIIFFVDKGGMHTSNELIKQPVFGVRNTTDRTSQNALTCLQEIDEHVYVL